MKSEKSFKSTLLLVILSVAVVAAIFISLLWQSREDYSDSYFYSMDTCVEIVGDNEIKDDVKQIFADTEKIFDVYADDSETSRLNSDRSITASQKLCDAVSRITELNEMYGNSADITVGALTRLWDITGDDPKVPSDEEIKAALATVGYENIRTEGNNITLENGALLDFGCAAKGAALDYVKEALDSMNAGKAVISAGSSSILLYGDDTFTTSILSPDSDEILGKLHTSSGFVSTSGGYHRYTVIDGKEYIHILDTETGCPSETDLTSVTVFCENGIDSDFLSTMIFAGGTENIDKYLASEDFLIAAVDSEKNVYVSEGLDFELVNEEYKYAEEDQ
ncbi:MAG: FAD:protein FMN transferase [Porcipelethomonas sp.]